MKIETITLPSHWVSALINCDWSGMDDNDTKELREWVEKNPECMPILDCSDKSHTARFNGLITDCLEYAYVVKS